jgi:hypothetical protein
MLGESETILIWFALHHGTSGIREGLQLMPLSSSSQLVLQLLSAEHGGVSTLHVEFHQELFKYNPNVGREGCAAISLQHGLILLWLCRTATAGSFPVFAFSHALLLRDSRSNLMALHVVFARSQNRTATFTEVACNEVFKVLKQA